MVRRRYRDETSITAALERQWDQMADFIIMRNLEKTNEEIVALIHAENGCKTAAWVQSRRRLFSKKQGTADVPGL